MKYSTLSSSLMLLLASTSFSAHANENKESQTTIFYGGPVITMEKSQPRAEAVVTSKYGKIVYVGSEQEALKQYPNSKKVDLDDKVLMPGFIEQHLHPFLAALTLNMPVIAPEEWQLPSKTWPAVTNHDDYIAALTLQEKALKDPNEVLWTWGFNNFFHGEISRQELDKISKTRPIGVWHRSAHEFYVNSAFIEKFGLNQTDIDKLGKEVADQANLDEGHFLEGGALIYLLPRIASELGNKERFSAGLKQMVTMLHQKGVTAYNEPGAFIPDYMIDTYLEILGGESTPMYSFFTPESKTPYFAKGKEGVLKEVERITTILPEDGKVRFFDKQVKLLFDGAIISQLMKMKDGYTDGHHGEWIQTPEDVEAITKIFWENDYQILVHVNGDLGVEKLIKILEKRQAEYPREDHRFTIIHFANSTDEQVEKLKSLGAIISVNPYYVTGFSEKFGEVGLGEERAHSMVRLATIEKQEIPVSLHSDAPMAPSDPLLLAWSAATRISNEGNVIRPDLALSRDAALRGITIEAAYSWGQEETLGSIRTGKIANFTILEQDPYKVEIKTLKDIPIYGTVFEGKLFPIDK
ncbi:hydrolase [Photobacterium sp. GB-27]|uniref:amidohydrolase n=1 Tax=unclassified Photobacterium TaxID=2628852 RepID=UPI000D1621F5|nr:MULTISPECIES: amidohydrolase [unclassified Photobacterium]PSV30056.1 hydrolase [Photobacterium sp. GB-72]PSV34010.1 hydrolase [Photobacterium sp. GB-27]PSV38040.1 hydrolase [Photobacterium sp. GB-210]PSV41816.1 hydrolase [Photobacterium sp. GB-36]PSV55740.1 hydrolase [Photobacterium sp. GB-3]